MSIFHNPVLKGETIIEGRVTFEGVDLTDELSSIGDLQDELAILNGLTATASELNILDGVTATTSELNILDGVTATTSELNILDGVTATTSELNILDGVTATTSELNILDGVTATTSEINAACDLSVRNEVVATSLANTLSIDESGKTIFLHGLTSGGTTTVGTTTLPTASLGAAYDFVVKTVPTASDTAHVITCPVASSFVGDVSINGATAPAANESTIRLTATGGTIGDWLSVKSDGTKYYISGSAVKAGAVAYIA